MGGTTVSNAAIYMSGGNADLKNLNGAVANIKGGVFYASGGNMSSAVVSGLGSAMGKMGIWSGTTVKNIDVYMNAHLAIMNGASVTSAYAGRTSGSDSASIGVSNGGRLGSAIVLGVLDIGSGGSVTSAVFSSGGKGLVSGILNFAVIHSGCPVQVSSGGYVDAATVSSGGRINVKTQMSYGDWDNKANMSFVPIAPTMAELPDRIREFDEEKYIRETDAFLKEKGCVDDGRSAQRIVDRILELMEKK